MERIEELDNGVLELYVAGVLPEEEMIKITKQVNESSALKSEVEQLETAFMEYAALHAPPISATTRDNILNTSKRANTPVITTTRRSRSFLFYLGWILFISSLSMNVYQCQDTKASQEQIQTLETEQRLFAEEITTLKQQFTEIRSIHTRSVILASTGKVPDAQAIVYWNTTTQNVWVDATALPTPPEGKVYQLWWMESLDPLTPYDAGTLDGFINNEDKFFAAKPTDRAIAFAITLEPEGGSESPTLEELYVLGQV